MHKILLVDDMRNFLDLEASFLLRAECVILTASTGLEAIRVAKAEQPHLILLDIEMPEMNGIQACRILKSDPSTQRIPVIMLTSMQMEEEAKRAGAEHFMRKPVDEPRFLTDIRKFLPNLVVRADERVELNTPVTFWRDGEAFDGRLLNLSRTGFFVACDDPQPVGARLEVSFSLPRDFSGKLITAEAIVVRPSDTARRGFACRFFQISSGARLFIIEFLERSAGPRSVEGR